MIFGVASRSQPRLWRAMTELKRVVGLQPTSYISSGWTSSIPTNQHIAMQPRRGWIPIAQSWLEEPWLCKGTPPNYILDEDELAILPRHSLTSFGRTGLTILRRFHRLHVSILRTYEWTAPQKLDIKLLGCIQVFASTKKELNQNWFSSFMRFVVITYQRAFGISSSSPTGMSVLTLRLPMKA